MGVEPTSMVHFQLEGLSRQLGVGVEDEEASVVFTVADIELRLSHQLTLIYDDQGIPDSDSSDSLIVASASRPVPESVVNALLERECLF